METILKMVIVIAVGMIFSSFSDTFFSGWLGGLVAVALLEFLTYFVE